MKAINIAALLAAASVGSAGLLPRDVPDVGRDVDTQCKHSSSVVQTRVYTTVEVERRCRTEEVRPVSTTPEPPIVIYPDPDGTQDADSDTPVPSFGGIPTDQVGDVITVTVTKPVTITEHGTIRTTVTEVVLAETIYQSTITHVNEIGKTVTEIVHYTTTLEVTGGSTIPFQVMPTLETRYETIVNGHTEYIVTHIGDVTTQTNGEVQHTITGGNEISTNDFGLTTYATQVTNVGGPTDDSNTATIPEKSLRTTATLAPETTGSSLFSVTSMASVSSISSGAEISTLKDSTSVAPDQSENDIPTNVPDSISTNSEDTSTPKVSTGEDSQNESISSTNITPDTSSSDGVNQQTFTTTANSGGAPHTDSPDVIHMTDITSNIDIPSSLTGTSTSKGNEITTTSPDRDYTPLDTNCPDQGPPLNDEERIMLDVIFNSGIGGTTYAQWLVNYASQLTHQVDNVASQAMADPNGQYTTAFDTIDITGILGLAYAAPMYTCFLSSLWAEALSNPQQYAKRDIPSQDEKTKLIVLFERRNDNNGDYNLAEILVRETENLLAEMNSVIAGQPLDLEGLNGRHLLAVALNAPIATEGLNDAILSALDSFFSTARLTTSEYLSTSGELPSATGSGDVPTPSFTETSDPFTATVPEVIEESDVPTPSFPVVTSVTETSDPFIATVPEVIEESDVPTPSFPVVTSVTETSDPFTATDPEVIEESDVPTPILPVVTFVTETSDPFIATVPEVIEESDVPTPSFPVVTSVTETSDPFTATDPEVIEEGDVPTPSFPVVTFVTDTSDPSTPTDPEATEFDDTPTPSFPVVTSVTETSSTSSSSSSAITTAMD